MPAFNTKDLLHSLEHDAKQLSGALAPLMGMTDAEWNQQPAPGKWSPAQIIEHLNSYNRYYLPEIAKALDGGTKGRVPFNPIFKAGVFGNYFTKMMQPGQGGKISNKMNAPKDHTPIARLDSSIVLKEFIAEQNKLLTYLQQAARTDIGKLKVPISISKFIKLKLGDTFRFLIAHQQRHFIQLHNALHANG